MRTVSLLHFSTAIAYAKSTSFCKVRFPKKYLKIMQEPFPLLESLALRSCDSALALPSTFLGGSSPRLRVLHLDVIAFPELPLFLSSASNLVDLQLERIPSPGYISPEALVAGLSSTIT
jgi:hypothetical protein